MRKITFNNGLVGKLVLPIKKSEIGLLLLHGGGEASKERYNELQMFLAENGFASFALDFRGCGESAGEFQDGSIEHRLEDAEDAYDIFQQYVKKIVVVGFSMGGHVASRLIESRYVYKLILFYPAAYALEAENKPLNKEFTKILHKENSWKTSPVFSAIAHFRNKVLIIYGENDKVVPKEIQAAYKKVLKKKDKFVIVLNVPHLFLRTSGKLQAFQEVKHFLHD